MFRVSKTWSGLDSQLLAGCLGLSGTYECVFSARKVVFQIKLNLFKIIRPEAKALCEEKEWAIIEGAIMT